MIRLAVPVSSLFFPGMEDLLAAVLQPFQMLYIIVHSSWIFILMQGGE